MVKIDPQPTWHEDPVKDDVGIWCGRYQYITYNDDVGVEVDCREAPSADVEPKEIDGSWYWATSN